MSTEHSNATTAKAKFDFFKAELDEGLAAYAKHAQEKKNLLDALEPFVKTPPSSIRVPSQNENCDVEIVFKPSSKEEVLEILKEFPPVTVLFVKGGVSWYAPEELKEKKVSAKYTPCEIGPVIYALAPQDGMGFIEEYHWWAHAGDKLVQVYARISLGNNSQKVARIIRTVQTTLPYRTYEAEYTLPKGKVTRWYTSYGMPRVTVHQSRDTDFGAAISEKQVYQFTFTKKICES